MTPRSRRIRVAPGVLWSEHQDVVYLVPPWAPVVRLNRTASSLFRALHEEDEVDAATQIWADERGIDPERANEFMTSLVDSLVARGLAELS